LTQFFLSDFSITIETINYEICLAAYLAYAPCMKTMYISPQHCGTHYEYLADLVKGNTASPDLMCWLVYYCKDSISILCAPCTHFTSLPKGMNYLLFLHSESS